jgi:2,3-bisphosphoglycerate-independent phosphoglycerate mutase
VQPGLIKLAANLAEDATLHLIGLVSDGGVHSAMEHLCAALSAAAELGIEKIAFHALTDGRDTAPDSAPRFIAELEAALPAGAFIASLGGRYFAMDRDRRWDRVERGWRVIVAAEGEAVGSAQEAIKQAYDRGESDEFIAPTVVRRAPIRDGDAVWFLNFRADRVRQFAAALIDDDEPDCFGRSLPTLSTVLGMVPYRADLAIETLFKPQRPEATLGALIAAAGLRQLRIAETEKYAHVTYFFNGGSEQEFAGEDRILVPSPRAVATYDLQPQMSAPEVTDRLVAAIASETYHLIVCNYANPDMVGHTGNLGAAVAAMHALDECLGRTLQAASDHGYGVLISADHGNIEQMRTADGKPHTQHTTGPVPLILIGMNAAAAKSGSLSDLAPTILDHMGLEQPPQMSGHSLLVRR